MKVRDGLTAPLRRVHRQVGPLEQFLGGESADPRLASASPMLGRMETSGHRRLNGVVERPHDAIGDRSSGLRARPRGRICELVAAEAGHGVPGADAAHDAVGDCVQQRVTGRVPQAVVDEFEVVEVQRRARPPARPSRCRSSMAWVQAVDEQRAVGQSGEGIPQGDVGDCVSAAAGSRPGARARGAGRRSQEQPGDENRARAGVRPQGGAPNTTANGTGRIGQPQLHAGWRPAVRRSI